MSPKAISLSLALLLGFSLPALAAEVAPATLSAPLRTLEGISEYRLPNGLRVLLAPDSGKPTTTVNITYMVGSRHEAYGETGMAHLLEHLLFKGTPSLPDGALDREMSRRGMKNNATTWYDRTNYFETFPASESNLEWALQMEADRMLNSFVAQKDLDSEMTVVRNEMERGENEPSAILLEKMSATAFQWHNYGKDTIGARSDVEQVRIENLQGFYRRYYQPDNAILTITGQFDEAQARALINKHFAGLAKPKRELLPTWTREPVQDGAREVSLRRVGDNPLLGLLYHIAPASHADFAATEVLGQILGNTPSGRLHKALVDKNLAVGVGDMTMALKEPGYAAYFVQLAKGQSLDAARAVALKVLEDFAKNPVSADELNRAKRNLANGFENTVNDPMQLGISLSEAIAAGDWRLFLLNRDRIAAVSAADVARVAKHYLKESNRTLGQFIPTAKPERATIPEAPDLEQLLADYKGNSSVRLGEVFEPSHANIEARTRRLRLGNGMQLALLSKQTRGATVQGSFKLHFGDEKNLHGHAATADALADMLLRGAGKLNRQAIEDQLSSLRSTLAFKAEAGALQVQFSSRRETLPQFLDLLASVLKQPTLAAQELRNYQREALASLGELRNQPKDLAELALARNGQPWRKGDPRYVADFDEQIAELRALTSNKLSSFHKAFYGSQHSELALVGDFDDKATEAQLSSLFGNWPSRSNYTRLAEPYRADSATTLTLQTPDKASANHVAQLVIHIKDSDADYPALKMAVQILGGDIPSRLWQRIRERDGLSYGVYARLLIDSEADAYSSIALEATFAPENRSRIETAYREELTRLYQDGISALELDEAKRAMLQTAKLGRSQDSALSAGLAAQLKLGRDMRFSKGIEERIEALSVQDVNAAIRKYIVPAQFVHVYAGDFAAAAKTAAK